MNKVTIALAVALLGAGVAATQPPPPPGPPPPYDRGAFWRGASDSPRMRIQFLQDRINRGLADGSLDRREGARANRELNNVRRWVHDMHWEDEGRLTPDQRGRVEARLDQLSSQIRWMRHSGW